MTFFLAIFRYKQIILRHKQLTILTKNKNCEMLTKIKKIFEIKYFRLQWRAQASRGGRGEMALGGHNRGPAGGVW